ncbi:hypothetical protein MTO96_000448 [Rhipicephalus appendiculatus]
MGADTTQPAEGNLYRDFWKRACWEETSNPTWSLYERAVYGALSGNVQEMFPACTTWEDQLWARMSALVDVRVDQEHCTAPQKARSLEPLPPGYPSDRGTFAAVFRDLQAAVGTSGMRDRDIMHILQRCLVLGDAVPMVKEMRNWETAQHMPEAPMMPPPHSAADTNPDMKMDVRRFQTNAQQTGCVRAKGSAVASLRHRCYPKQGKLHGISSVRLTIVSWFWSRASMNEALHSGLEERRGDACRTGGSSAAAKAFLLPPDPLSKAIVHCRRTELAAGAACYPGHPVCMRSLEPVPTTLMSCGRYGVQAILLTRFKRDGLALFALAASRSVASRQASTSPQSSPSMRCPDPRPSAPWFPFFGITAVRQAKTLATFLATVE